VRPPSEGEIDVLAVAAAVALISTGQANSQPVQLSASTAGDEAARAGEHFAPSPEVRAMLRAVDPDRIARYDRTLVSFHNRNTLSEQNNPNRGIGAARDYIYGQFQQFAKSSGGRMAVRLQSYAQPTVPGAIPRPTRITNVVATLRGTQPASVGRTYVVSGHYDSRCTDVLDTKCFAPGADDDSSGVSGVLEMARVMAGHRFDATIIFMAVAGEEQGLFGSTHFVQQAKKQHLNVAGMLDNDIIGTSNGENPHSIRLFSEGVPSD